MNDVLGRTITYLRLSVTERCDLRCRYCMAEDGVPKRRHDDLCSFEELRDFATAAASRWFGGGSLNCAPCCEPFPVWRSFA